MKRAALIVLVACNSPSSRTPVIESVTPDYGPLVGGTRIVIAGSGFTDDASQGTRVFVGGREAPLANAVDDATLEVVIPPGDIAGPSELIVLNANGNAIANDRFRYSTEPAITGVSPADVLYRQPTQLTVTGSGFLDEGAGDTIVLVDGVPALDVEIVSDSALRFTAPDGRALGRPRIEISNTRGLGTKERAFRYRPSPNSGLLLFPRNGPFAIFYDPIANVRVDIPRIGSTFISTVIVDAHGEYWATEGSRIGRLDLSTQRIEQSAPIQFRLPAMTRVDDTIYGLDRWTLRFGTLTLDGIFTPIGNASIPCCGSYGITGDGTTLYFTSRSGVDKTINTIDPATGATGTPVKLAGAPVLHVEELRAFKGTLYATSRDGTLVRIDPQTGQTTPVVTVPRANAMEVFE